MKSRPDLSTPKAVSGLIRKGDRGMRATQGAKGQSELHLDSAKLHPPWGT